MSTDPMYYELAKTTAYAESELLIKILAAAMSPEDAAFLLALPAPASELASKFNLDEQAVAEKIKGLMRRGLACPSDKGPKFQNEVALLRDETLASAPEYIPAELPGLWKEFHEAGFRKDLATWFGGVKGAPYFRIVPAQKAVPKDVELLPSEDLNAIIKAGKSAAVRDCCCRIMMKECDAPLHTCLQFNGRADYALERGGAKPLSLDEVMQAAFAAEDAGLVPLVANIDGVERQDYICYCCGCCCVVLDPLKRTDQLATGLAKSRFQAGVNKDACTGCQTCVGRCHFDAIEMEKVPGSKKLKATVDPEKCYGCGACVLKCKPQAITLSLVRPPEYIPSSNPNIIA